MLTALLHGRTIIVCSFNLYVPLSDFFCILDKLPTSDHLLIMYVCNVCFDLDSTPNP